MEVITPNFITAGLLTEAARAPPVNVDPITAVPAAAAVVESEARTEEKEPIVIAQDAVIPPPSPPVDFLQPGGGNVPVFSPTNHHFPPPQFSSPPMFPILPFVDPMMYTLTMYAFQQQQQQQVAMALAMAKQQQQQFSFGGVGGGVSTDTSSVVQQQPPVPWSPMGGAPFLPPNMPPIVPVGNESDHEVREGHVYVRKNGISGFGSYLVGPLAFHDPNTGIFYVFAPPSVDSSIKDDDSSAASSEEARFPSPVNPVNTPPPTPTVEPLVATPLSPPPKSSHTGASASTPSPPVPPTPHPLSRRRKQESAGGAVDSQRGSPPVKLPTLPSSPGATPRKGVKG